MEARVKFLRKAVTVIRLCFSGTMPLRAKPLGKALWKNGIREGSGAISRDTCLVPAAGVHRRHVLCSADFRRIGYMGA